MAPLTADEVLQLSTSIQYSLSHGQYACSSLSRITGGSSSFTFRGQLKTPIRLSDERIVTTVIVKKATDFAAVNKNFALDSNRSTYEDFMLNALRKVRLGNVASTVSITSPISFFYDDQSHVQVIEDLQPAIDLASVLKSSTISNLPSSDYPTLGFALGAWLCDFHSWTQKPEQSELRDIIAQNKSSQSVNWRTTYDTIEAIVAPLQMISGEDKQILADVRARAASKFEQHRHYKAGEQSDQTGYGVIHGDFWTGK
ncbi:hypothetical protein N0V95_006530 [Ascochyta clinopodiicola]|nr:hypothetical protein N0V95_006530 [Ascochyta clinopodiicola]